MLFGCVNELFRLPESAVKCAVLVLGSLLTMSELTEFFRSEAPAAAAETLDFLLYECSADEAPTAAEVAEWQAVFAARGGKFLRLAGQCRQWLAEEGA